MKLSVYTQNCFGVPVPGSRRRLVKISEKILEIKPDVVFLQEIQWKSFVKVFRSDEYEMAFDDGFYATKGGLLTLVRKAHKFDFGFVKFSSQGGIRQLADRGLGKGLLDVYFPKHKLHLINTHFLATYMPGIFRDKGQERQLEQFLEYTHDFKLFVGAGDLNFSDKSKSYLKLVETIEDFSADIGVSHPVLKSKIDFVFGRGVKRILKKEYVGYDSFVSDHKGILVELEL